MRLAPQRLTPNSLTWINAWRNYTSDSQYDSDFTAYDAVLGSTEVELDQYSSELRVASDVGGTLEYQVEHPRWDVWDVPGATLSGDTSALYGPEFADALTGPPRSAFLAVGSEVAVYPGRRIV